MTTRSRLVRRSWNRSRTLLGGGRERLRSRVASRSRAYSRQSVLDLSQSEVVDLDDLHPRTLTGDHLHRAARKVERLGEELAQRFVRAPPFRDSRDAHTPTVSVSPDELAPARARRHGDADSRHLRGQVLRKLLEDRDVLVGGLVAVRDRDRPLLLAPGWRRCRGSCCRASRGRSARRPGAP